MTSIHALWRIEKDWVKGSNLDYVHRLVCGLRSGHGKRLEWD
jgi:hypothetical protein